MSKFFAFLGRMKLINRWGLMRNGSIENVLEHTAMTSFIAHGLAEIENNVFGGSVDRERVVLYALYHESAEVITGDLPTPVKYFNSDMVAAYKAIEKNAEDKLIKTLPKELTRSFSALIQPDKNSAEYALVKYADKLAALIKCIEELSNNNAEFASAAKTIEKALENAPLSVKYFMDTFIPAFKLSLDELSEG